MARQVDGPTDTVKAGEALGEFDMVKLVSGIAYKTTGVAGEDNAAYGVMQEAVAVGKYGTVRVMNCVASSKCRAAAAITKGARVFTAADGEVTSTATSLTSAGIAAEAASAANEIIEVKHVKGANDDIT
jgi:hypothetical protein